MLTCGIEEDFKDKFDLAKIFLDSMKMYINPELYKDEYAYRTTGKLAGQSVNMDHKRQRETGRLYGKQRSSPIVQRAIDKLYKKGKSVTDVVMGSVERLTDKAQVTKNLSKSAVVSTGVNSLYRSSKLGTESLENSNDNLIG